MTPENRNTAWIAIISLVVRVLLWTSRKTRISVGEHAGPSNTDRTSQGDAARHALDFSARGAVPFHRPGSHAVQADAESGPALHGLDIWARYPQSSNLVAVLGLEMQVWDAILDTPSTQGDEAIVATLKSQGLDESFAAQALAACHEWDSYGPFLERLLRNEEIARMKETIDGTQPDAHFAQQIDLWNRAGQEGNSSGIRQRDALLLERQESQGAVKDWFAERWARRYGLPIHEAHSLLDSLKSIHVSDVNPSELAFPRIKK